MYLHEDPVNFKKLIEQAAAAAGRSAVIIENAAGYAHAKNRLVCHGMTVPCRIPQNPYLHISLYLWNYLCPLS